MNNYLSIITLNVNGLNAPIKRHRTRWEDGGNIGGSGVHFPSIPGKYLADLRNRGRKKWQ